MFDMARSNSTFSDQIRAVRVLVTVKVNIVGSANNV